MAKDIAVSLAFSILLRINVLQYPPLSVSKLKTLRPVRRKPPLNEASLYANPSISFARSLILSGDHAGSQTRLTSISATPSI